MSWQGLGAYRRALGRFHAKLTALAVAAGFNPVVTIRGARQALQRQCRPHLRRAETPPRGTGIDMAVVLENVTERLQRHLGIQQAQTIQPEDFAADGIARLLGRRGDPSRVAQLWRRQERGALVANYRPKEHDDVLEELARVLDGTLVVQREKGSGATQDVPSGGA